MCWVSTRSDTNRTVGSKKRISAFEVEVLCYLLSKNKGSDYFFPVLAHLGERLRAELIGRDLSRRPFVRLCVSILKHKYL